MKNMKGQIKGKQHTCTAKGEQVKTNSKERRRTSKNIENTNENIRKKSAKKVIKKENKFSQTC